MARSGKKAGRLSQIRQTYQITKRTDPKIGWLLLAIFLGVWALFIAGAFIFASGTLTRIMVVVLGFTTALLATSFVFGKRAEKSAYSQIADQPGALSENKTRCQRGRGAGVTPRWLVHHPGSSCD